MAGLGKIGAALGQMMESKAGQDLQGVAVQQAGMQLGSQLGNAPAALRAKLASVEQFGESPSGWGSTPLDAWFPEFRHTIFVAVSGGPTADIKDIWKLAVSAAFGRYRQRISTFAGVSVECIWDITDKSVGIRLTYGSNGLIPAALAAFEINGDGATSIIQRGPVSETVGGTWAGFLQTVPQILNPYNRESSNTDTVGGRETPKTTGSNPDPETPGNTQRKGRLEREGEDQPDVLPDDGRLITTAYKGDHNVQPPRPADYTNLVALVANALSSPCYLPCSPPVGKQVEEPEGYRFYQPGGNSKPGRKTDKEIIQDAIKHADRFPAEAVDGYETPNDQSKEILPDECGVDTEIRQDLPDPTGE